MTWEMILDKAERILTHKIATINETELTPQTIILFLAVFALLLIISKILTRVIDSKVLTRLRIDTGLQYALKRIIHYVLLIISAVFSFQLIGIDFTGLAVIFGFLSVGIGFGLQNITSNFVSGLIILLERPVKVGDRISVGDVQGEIQSINMRSSTIQTLDDITIIVPNSQLIESQVTNWSYGHTRMRVRIPIGVSYDSDLDTVTQALMNVANAHDKVMDTPAPSVIFDEFGASSWNLFLAVWINNNRDYFAVKSDINKAIVHKFREKNIEIPFPQQDIHFRNAIPTPGAMN